jgi:hypothetical protein
MSVTDIVPAFAVPRIGDGEHSEMKYKSINAHSYCESSIKAFFRRHCHRKILVFTTLITPQSSFS